MNKFNDLRILLEGNKKKKRKSTKEIYAAGEAAAAERGERVVADTKKAKKAADLRTEIDGLRNWVAGDDDAFDDPGQGATSPTAHRRRTRRRWS